MALTSLCGSTGGLRHPEGGCLGHQQPDHQREEGPGEGSAWPRCVGVVDIAVGLRAVILEGGGAGGLAPPVGLGFLD